MNIWQNLKSRKAFGFPFVSHVSVLEWKHMQIGCSSENVFKCHIVTNK